MTIETVEFRILAESSLVLTPNLHGDYLSDLLVRPRLIVLRLPPAANLPESLVSGWLIAEQKAPSGYRIVMSEDGARFGLAVPGFRDAPDLMLVGWHGDLASTFAGM